VAEDDLNELLVDGRGLGADTGGMRVSGFFLKRGIVEGMIKEKLRTVHAELIKKVFMVQYFT
jgi:hypothetical protein